MLQIAFVAGARLSTARPERHRHWERAAERVALLQPALTVHLGDLTEDGTRTPQSLQFAAECLQDWPTPWRSVPGARDVCGPGPAGAAAPGALLRYRRLIGADRWCLALGRWRVVGLNTTLFGTGCEAEQDQWDWLQALAAADTRRNLLLCLDRPLARTPLEAQCMPQDHLPMPAAERLIGNVLGDRLVAVVTAGLPALDQADGWRRDMLPTTPAWQTAEQLVLGPPAQGMGWLTLDKERIELGYAALDRCPAGRHQEDELLLPG